MTDGVTIPNVAGSIDGIVPVYTPGGRFQIWRSDQIFQGTHGKDRYVPNVGDIIISNDDPRPESWVQVVSVSETTLLARTRPLQGKTVETDVDERDLLIGVGPGSQSDTFRVYVDKSVRPYTLAVDARCAVYGTDMRNYQIVKGSELDGTLKVVSTLYDQSGTYVGQSVPLELANMRDHSNRATWTFPTCTTSEELEDNDIVYVRVYSDTGGLRTKFPLLVENTSFIRLTDSATKYVTHISLDTPFLSSSDPHLVEYPVNVPLSGLNLFGIVHYNDGSTKRMPVDGTKFQIFGFNHFVATTVGERNTFTLQYNLSADEIHYGSTVADSRAIQQDFQSVSTKEDGSYSVKLFCYPVWNSGINGYLLEFFMFNLDRRTWMNVTPYVKSNANMPAFNPRLYGVSQQLSYSIDLREVNPSFKSWIHVQVIDIVLYRPASDHSDTPWTVSYERNQTPPFGRGNWAKITHATGTVTRINIAQDETDLTQWLERLYRNTKPLFSPIREIRAPEPNMFAIERNGAKFEFPIDQWNTELTVNTRIASEDTVFIRFFRRSNDIDLQLAMAALPAIHYNRLP